MTRRICRPIALLVGVIAVAVTLDAQGGRGAANWSTANADAQRTGWIRTETRISTATVKQQGASGLQLLWKVKPAEGGRHPLTAPLILQNLISHKGFKALIFLANADTVWAYDYDLAKVYWSTRLATASAGASGGRCAARTTSLTRSTPLTQSAVPGTVEPVRAVAPPAPPAPSRGPVAGVNPNNLPIRNAVWAISTGGMLHALNPHIGGDIRPPIGLVPRDAKVTGSLLVNNVLYTTTSENCGGAPNGLVAVDVMEPSPPRFLDSRGANIAGTAGPALGLNNMLYVATGSSTEARSAKVDGAATAEAHQGNAVFAVDPKTLAVTDWFRVSTAPFTTSPVAFVFARRDLIAAANADGRIYVLDAASLGGPNHATPLVRSEPYTNDGADPAVGTLATWQQPDGTRWILAASRRAIVAFKVVEQGSGITMQEGWTRELTSPLAPIVINNVVFAVSRGTRAMLHALDAVTGAEIWDSGAAIAGGAPVVGPSGQDGQVYVSTPDGTLYAFGIPLEH